MKQIAMGSLIMVLVQQATCSGRKVMAASWNVAIVDYVTRRQEHVNVSPAILALLVKSKMCSLKEYERTHKYCYVNNLCIFLKHNKTSNIKKKVKVNLLYYFK